MSVNAILIILHCGSNIGYAIEPLEKTFYKMAKILFKDESKIYFAYKHMKRGFPKSLPGNFKNVITFDPGDNSSESLDFIYNYIKTNKIDVIFGFDQPVTYPAFPAFRKAGIRHFISYWGSSMSRINHGYKLFLKRLEVMCRRYKPDHFIFESNAMASTAIYGRGINPKNVSVINLGVDAEKYKPVLDKPGCAYEMFNIPQNRKIVFYSGHMEERKGVDVIVKSAVELVERRKCRDVHFLITGNKNGEEKLFKPLYQGTEAENHITFGGYCNNLPLIMPSCYIGTIASTGWDSFPRSAMEMASCGLPLVVSNLQGLVESVENNITGYLFKPGDSGALADKIEYLIDNPEKRNFLSNNARQRVLDKFTLTKQLENLVTVVGKVISS